MRLNLWLNVLKFSLFSVGTSAISVQEHWVRQQEERLRQGLFGNDGTRGFRIAADDPPEAPVYGDAIQVSFQNAGIKRDSAHITGAVANRSLWDYRRNFCK